MSVVACQGGSHCSPCNGLFIDRPRFLFPPVGQQRQGTTVEFPRFAAAIQAALFLLHMSLFRFSRVLPKVFNLNSDAFKHKSASAKSSPRSAMVGSRLTGSKVIRTMLLHIQHRIACASQAGFFTMAISPSAIGNTQKQQIGCPFDQRFGGRFAAEIERKPA